MMEYQVTAMEGKHPDCLFSEGDSGLIYAIDSKRNALAIFGVKGCAKLTLAQLKTLEKDLPEWIAELEESK